LWLFDVDGTSATAVPGFFHEGRYRLDLAAKLRV
jgi:hypothetical protein